MRKVTSAGGLIVRDNKLLVVKHEAGYYGFVKGHQEPGETVEETAIREVREEAALEAVIIRRIGMLTRRSIENSGEIVEKDTVLFLMESTGPAADVVPEEVTEWLPLAQVADKLYHPEDSDFMRLHAPELVMR